MADGVGAPNQELQYGFALLSPSVVSHSLRKQNSRSEPGHFSKSIYLISVELYSIVYRCLERSYADSSFTLSRQALLLKGVFFRGIEL
ncbi:hypothetical protein TNCV_2308911 [Trichonephila clavipes]|nr:hypothetical protein TNCV_2308911 [Trichonephila clavipes]